MRWIGLAALAALAVGSGHAWAAGDFPPASCKGWNGTVVERDGIDTTRATAQGIVTKADLQEYCERDPGGETKQYGGKLTTAQCVAKYLRSEGRATMAAEANCRAGTVSYRYGERQGGKARFPLGPDANTSCASAVSCGGQAAEGRVAAHIRADHRQRPEAASSLWVGRPRELTAHGQAE